VTRLVLACVLVAGCGAPQAPVHALAGEPTEHDADAEPMVLGTTTLPPIPASVHETDEVVSEALRVTREAIVPDRPPLDDAASNDETARYMREDFHAWLVSRARSIATARHALSAMEHGEPDEYVLASALVGTLFAMLAREVVDTPLPRVVRGDRTQRVLVREALLEAAAPLYRRALDAFGACASTASGAADPTLEPWASYCDDASERALEAPRPVDEHPVDEPPADEHPVDEHAVDRRGAETADASTTP
jgi:hypothetical protein